MILNHHTLTVDQPSSLPGQLPLAQSAIEVSNSSYIPCFSLDVQVKVFIRQLSTTANGGCDVYKQIARYASLLVAMTVVTAEVHSFYLCTCVWNNNSN